MFASVSVNHSLCLHMCSKVPAAQRGLCTRGQVPTCHSPALKVYHYTGIYTHNLNTQSWGQNKENQIFLEPVFNSMCVNLFSGSQCWSSAITAVALCPWSWPLVAAAARSSTAPGTASWRHGTKDTRTSVSGCQVGMRTLPSNPNNSSAKQNPTPGALMLRNTTE